MRCQHAVGEVYNVGNGEEITIMDLAVKIKAMTNSSADIRCIPYDIAYGKGFEDMEFRTPDITKINEAIGYRPTVNLDNILRRVICHFEEIQTLAVVAEPIGGLRAAH